MRIALLVALALALPPALALGPAALPATLAVEPAADAPELPRAGPAVRVAEGPRGMMDTLRRDEARMQAALELPFPILPPEDPEPEPPASCETEGDAGDTFESATPRPWPGACDGATSWNDTHDWYVLTLAAGEYVNVSVAASHWSAEVCLVRPDSTEDYCDAGEASRVVGGGVAGDWRVHLRDEWEYGWTYTMNVTSSLPPLPPDDCGTGVDAGDSAGAATPLPFPAACDGDFSRGDRYDWYAIDLAVGQHIEVEAIAPGLHAIVCILDPEGWYVACEYDYDGAPLAVAAIDVPGAWLVGVELDWGGEGSYHFEVREASPPPAAQDDCGTGSDAPRREDATLPLLALPSACEGVLNEFDHVDRFQIALAAGEHAELRVAGGVNVCVATPDGARERCDFSWDDEDVVVRFGDDPGAWRVVIWQWSDVAYALDAALMPPAAPQDDCGTGADASDNYDGATPIALGAACLGTLENYYDPVDWLAVELGADDYARFDVVADQGALAVACLIRPDGRTHACRYEAPFALSGHAEGRWVLAVALDPSAGSLATYAASATLVAPPAPQDDCGSGADAAAEPPASPTLPRRVTCDGMLGGAFHADVDGYVVDVPANTGFLLRVEGQEGLEICARPPTGYPSCSSNWNGQTAELDMRLGAEAGAWRITVSTWLRGVDLDYTLDVGAGYVTEFTFGIALYSQPETRGAIQRNAGPLSTPLGVGVDGWWYALPAVATGREVMSVHDVGGLHLQSFVDFYDADGNLLTLTWGECRDGAGEWWRPYDCVVPEGAAHAYVYNGYARGTDLAYTYLPDA